MKSTKTLSLTVLLSVFLLAILSACEPDRKDLKEVEGSETEEKTEAAAADQPADDKGIGEIKNVELTTPLNEEMVTRGQAIYDMKCAACHKLDETKVVGPGWAGVTKRRKPEWIMNFVTNVDIMLDKDPQAQKLLEECLTRMPNQNISIGDARDLLEFMRKNDGEK